MLKVNLRHLEEHGVRLKGELSAADLDLGVTDDLIRADQRNVDRFQDLTQFLRKNVEKRTDSKEKPQGDSA